jgi:hypothetical protein
MKIGMPKAVAIRVIRALLTMTSAVLLLLAVGCATIGRDFPSARIEEIRPGVTTKMDLLAEFGRPYRRGIEDGDSTWTYLHYKLRLIFGQTRTRDLYIRFRGDTVSSYTYNADEP